VSPPIASDQSTIEEVDELESTRTNEDSLKLGSLTELNNCKLFTIVEDNENSLEEGDLQQKEVKRPDLYHRGHHI
jgi:hypothetical protein